MVVKFSRYTILGLLLIAGCSSTSEHSIKTKNIKNPIAIQVNLPVNQKIQWVCDNNQFFDVKLSSDKQSLYLTIQNKEYILKYMRNRLPIIYQNNEIAFFTNGERAVLGQPYGSIVYQTGCYIPK